MRRAFAAAALVLFATLAFADTEETPMITGIIPILTVDAIEPCLPFWMERLGFANAAEVPHGDALGFVMLTAGEVTVMYQTKASIEDDIPGALTVGTPSSTLYVNVSSLEDVIAKMGGFDVVVPERTTFYGMREFAVREPGGNTIIFAQRVEE